MGAPARAAVTLKVTGQPAQYRDEQLFAEDFGMSKDAFAAVAGDGQAGVTVSFEMKDSDYGTGVGAFVSVSLRCTQSTETLEMAYRLAASMSRDLAQQAFAEAREAFEESK